MAENVRKWPKTGLEHSGGPKRLEWRGKSWNKLQDVLVENQDTVRSALGVPRSSQKGAKLPKNGLLWSEFQTLKRLECHGTKLERFMGRPGCGFWINGECKGTLIFAQKHPKG